MALERKSRGERCRNKNLTLDLTSCNNAVSLAIFTLQYMMPSRYWRSVRPHAYSVIQVWYGS